jgi:hypothetical protein
VTSDTLKCLIIVTALLILAPVSYISSEEARVYLREDFNDLQNWEPLHFEKINKHTEYRVVKEGDNDMLETVSNSSASGLISRDEFNVYEYPNAKWRWRISNVYKKGNAKEKSGDDYPIRIYFVFKYDPDKASFMQRAKYGLYKKLHGEYPPHSSINYIWANRQQSERIITNSYSDETMMIILQAGDEKAGRWQDEEVNIIDDYRSAFGEDPPPVVRIAIMNDSDNTGESSTSHIDHIELFN